MARILLIDDNALLRTLLRLQLEAAGHEVLEAADGGEGIRLYRSQPVDLVLCDLFMPGKEGLETIRELRGSGAGRIIAISGDGPLDASDFLRIATMLGAARALNKPFDAATLLEAVRDVLQAPG
jgi:CheY-like chemotaxis protein